MKLKLKPRWTHMYNAKPVGKARAHGGVRSENHTAGKCHEPSDLPALTYSASTTIPLTPEHLTGLIRSRLRSEGHSKLVAFQAEELAIDWCHEHKGRISPASVEVVTAYDGERTLFANGHLIGVLPTRATRLPELC